MKMKKIVSNKRLSLVLIFILSSIFIYYFVQQENLTFEHSHDDLMTPSNIKSNNNRIIKRSYISHNTILIDSDDDLAVFPGSGTKSDPYIIGNFNITSSIAHPFVNFVNFFLLFFVFLII